VVVSSAHEQQALVVGDGGRKLLELLVLLKRPLDLRGHGVQRREGLLVLVSMKAEKKTPGRHCTPRAVGAEHTE
jgi:hypothetical protein